mgnify:CR=1 FL=1
MVRATKYLKGKFGDLSFGQLIWAHRKSEEMTQAQLSEMLGVSKQYISQLEKGERLASVEQAVRLAEVFKMSPEIFVVRSLQDQVTKAGISLIIKSA